MSGRPLLPLALAGLLALAAAARSTPALARTAAARTPDLPRREGLALGVAMGAASLKSGFEGFDNGGETTRVGTAALDLQFGGMLNRRIALLFHLNIARGSSDGGVQFLHASALVGFRLFLTRVFWAELAAGTSGYQERDTVFDTTLEEHAHSFAYLLGVGIEVFQGRSFTIDVRANLAFAEYDHGFSASLLQGLIGLNWY